MILQIPSLLELVWLVWLPFQISLDQYIQCRQCSLRATWEGRALSGLGHCQSSLLLSDSAFSQSHAFLHDTLTTAIFWFRISYLRPSFQSGYPILPCSLSPTSGLSSMRPLVQRGAPMPSPRSCPPQARCESVWSSLCLCSLQREATLQRLREILCIQRKKDHLHSIQFTHKNNSVEKQSLTINAAMNYAVDHKHRPQILCLQEMALYS